MKGRQGKGLGAENRNTLHRSIRRTMALCVAVCALLGLASLKLLAGSYDEAFATQQSEVAERYFSQLKTCMNDSVLLSRQLLGNETIQTALAQILDTDASTRAHALARTQLREATAVLAGDRPRSIEHVDVVDANGNFYSYGAMPMTADLQTKLMALTTRCPRDGAAYWYALNDDGTNYLVLARAIRETKNLSLRHLGFELMMMDLRDCLSKADAVNQRFINTTDIYLDGELICQGKNSPAGGVTLPLDVRWRLMTISGRRYLVTQGSFFSDRIWVVNFLDHMETTRALEQVRLGLTGSLLAVLLAVLLIGVRGVDKRFRNLEKLTDTVSHMQYGELHVELDPELLAADDEVGVFARRFQHAMNRIDDLVNRDLKKQLFATQAQCRMLQAQIRPHFLYNTLETIHAAAIRDGNTDISRMALSLSRLVRASYRGSMWGPLQSEISFVQEYLSIYRIRFGERLQALIEYDPDDGDILLPQMTLQPLVENSIRYGLMKKVGKGRVRLRIRHTGNRLKISLYDNGVGFPKELMDKYQNMLLAQQLELHGTANVLARLKYTYGDDAVVQMRSREGCWTNLSIIIPDELPDSIRKEAEENVQGAACG